MFGWDMRDNLKIQIYQNTDKISFKVFQNKLLIIKLS